MEGAWGFSIQNHDCGKSYSSIQNGHSGDNFFFHTNQGLAGLNFMGECLFFIQKKNWGDIFISIPNSNWMQCFFNAKLGLVFNQSFGTIFHDQSYNWVEMLNKDKHI